MSKNEIVSLIETMNNYDELANKAKAKADAIRDALKEEMRRHCDAGNTVFFSTHVLDVAEKLCDNVAIIKNGKLIAHGTMDSVRGDGSLERVFLELEDHKD